MISKELYLGEDTEATRRAVQNTYSFCFRKLETQGLNGGLGLEIGANQGFGLTSPEAVGFRTITSDIDLKYAAIAKKNLPDSTETLVLNGLNIPIESASLDYVFMHQVLEHIEQEDQEKALAEIKRVLRPNRGIAFISTPNKDSRPSWSKPYSPDHKYELTEEEFIELLNHHFAKVEIYGHSFLPKGIKGFAYQSARTILGDIYFNLLPRPLRLSIRNRLVKERNGGKVRTINPGETPRSILAVCSV